HLQDAVPVTLGQEFTAYADIIKEHGRRVESAADDCLMLGIGGTATGTGLNAHPQYRVKMCDELAKKTGIPFTPSANLMEAMQSMAPFTNLSGALRNFAADLYKVTTDLRMMDSGPFTGISEIQMPPVQPGSSIMPGKVNPVLCEMTAMVCFQVFGTDLTIANAAQAGNFELNVMMPIIAFNLGLEMRILTTTCNALQTKCIREIKANVEKCLHYAESTLMLVTALSPHIGYLKAADVARECLKTGKTIRQVALEWNLLPPEKLDEVLDLRKMANLD
ncbi:MAG: lyase family protein, partial [Methylocella sp.]